MLSGPKEEQIEGTTESFEMEGLLMPLIPVARNPEGVIDLFWKIFDFLRFFRTYSNGNVSCNINSYETFVSPVFIYVLRIFFRCPTTDTTIPETTSMLCLHHLSKL